MIKLQGWNCWVGVQSLSKVTTLKPAMTNEVFSTIRQQVLIAFLGYSVRKVPNGSALEVTTATWKMVARSRSLQAVVTLPLVSISQRNHYRITTFANRLSVRRCRNDLDLTTRLWYDGSGTLRWKYFLALSTY